MNSESLLQYPFAQLPSHGETLRVAPGVHWLRMPLPFALDHINLWLLEDGDQWVIIDCGFGNDATRALWKQLIATRIGALGVSRVIATHHHPDHVGNAGWLTRQFGAPLCMPQGEYLSAHALCDGAAGQSREHMAALFRRNGFGLVGQVRRQPALGQGGIDAAAARIVGNLVAPDMSDAEIARLRMRKIEAGDRGRRQHRE